MAGFQEDHPAIRSVGIDLGKTTFHLVALGAAGKVLVKRKFTQKQLLTYTANLQTSLIGLEACAGAHFLGRALRDSAPFGAWLDRLDARSPKNVVVVAMANKLARIAWAVLSSGNDYRSAAVAA